MLRFFGKVPIKAFPGANKNGLKFEAEKPKVYYLRSLPDARNLFV